MKSMCKLLPKNDILVLCNENENGRQIFKLENECSIFTFVQYIRFFLMKFSVSIYWICARVIAFVGVFHQSDWITDPSGHNMLHSIH